MNGCVETALLSGLYTVKLLIWKENNRNKDTTTHESKNRLSW